MTKILQGLHSSNGLSWLVMEVNSLRAPQQTSSLALQMAVGVYRHYRVELSVQYSCLKRTGCCRSPLYGCMLTI